MAVLVFICAGLAFAGMKEKDDFLAGIGFIGLALLGVGWMVGFF